MNNSFTELLINQALENRDFDLIKRIQSGEYFQGKENAELEPFDKIEDEEHLCKRHLSELQVQEIKDTAYTMYIKGDKNIIERVNEFITCTQSVSYSFADKDELNEDGTYKDGSYRVATMEEFIEFLNSRGKYIKMPIRLKTQIVKCYLIEDEFSYTVGWDSIMTFGDYWKTGQTQHSNRTYPIPDDYKKPTVEYSEGSIFKGFAEDIVKHIEGESNK